MPELVARGSAGPPFAEVLIAFLLLGSAVLLAFLWWRLRRARGSKSSPPVVLGGVVKTSVDAFRLEITQKLTRFHSTFLWEEAGRRRAQNSFFLVTDDGPSAIEVDDETNFIVEAPSETYWRDPKERVRAFVVRQGMRVWVELAPGTRRATRVTLGTPALLQNEHVGRAKGTLLLGVLSVVVALLISHQTLVCSFLGGDTVATVVAAEQLSPNSKWARMEVTFQTQGGQTAVDDLPSYAPALAAGQQIPVREVPFASWWTGIGHGPRVSAVSYGFSTLGLLQVLLLMWAFRRKPVRKNALREAHTTPMPDGAAGTWIRSDK